MKDGRSIALTTMLCLISHGLCVNDVPVWHPRYARRARVSQNQPMPVKIASQTTKGFEAHVQGPDGCTPANATVESGTVIIKGDCGSSQPPADRTAASSRVKQQPAVGLKRPNTEPPTGDEWSSCSKCSACIPTLPPHDGDVAPVASAVGDLKAECGACSGCTVSLKALGQATDFKWSPKKTVKVFQGASGAAVMKGETTEGSVIVKMWCDLVGEWRQAKEHKPVPFVCKDENPTTVCPQKGGLIGHKRCNHRFLDSLNAITEEAGLASITPKAWSAPVRSILPEGIHQHTGVRVDSRGQFYKIAPGVSLESVTGGVVTNENLPMLLGIPSEQVVKAAMLDLLFSEQDRHGQNVFVDEDYNMMVIDNEGAYGPLNSMFIPGTQKFEIYRVGYGAVCCGNLPPGNCPGRVTPSSPETLMDYRCHVAGGSIGFNYPPGVKEFIDKLAGMSAEDIFNKYQMSHMNHAKTLRERLDLLSKHGFEETIKAVLARQEKGDGVRYGHNFWYPIHPPCCDIATCNLRKQGDLKLSENVRVGIP
eukprot:CAMPEP_0114225066 /NCGR_PEP_ID=MMETSP0058-20121206/455_1 /TAXON_ID=36894 /ORGANISM="Pyramimonas parkeae, CCMP726" /LENGTH=534 /DNA_ID=CAMNT_0001335609 /DNA_START=97 /DNA_END=1701 /DNA_ORIENTATION=-